MSNKKIIGQKRLMASVKAGAVGCLFSMLLLLPGAVFVYTEQIPMEQSKILIWIAGFTGALLAQLLYNNKQQGRGAVIALLVSTGVYVALALTICAGIPGGALKMDKFISTVISAFLGNTVGAFIVINKLYRRNRRHIRNYT